MTSSPADRTDTDTIVLIHGLWMTPRSWEHWVQRYQRAGFRVLAPAWPGMEGEVEELRADPTPIAELTAERVVDHYDQIIRELDRPPIIMGHSFGGAFAQILLDRGLGVAAVAIDPAAMRGVVRVPLSTLRSVFPILRSPANRHRAVPLTAEQFHYGLANALGAAESAAAYERYHVPAAGHILFQSAVANWELHSAFDVNFGNNDRAPLVLIAGGADHIAPPSVTRTTGKLYRKSTALTGYREFAGRCHFTLGQEGWEEVADYALDWATQATSQRLVLTD